MKRRIILLTRHLDEAGRNEQLFLRFMADEIVGVIDTFNSGRKVSDVTNFNLDIPIASGIDEFSDKKPNYLLIGLYGGLLKTDWYPLIIKALQMKINIISGLHQALSEIAEFSLLADKYGAKLYDLRKPPSKYYKQKKGLDDDKKRILITATTESSLATITTLELAKSMRKKGFNSDWLPTSLCGTIIKKKDVIPESVKADQLASFIAEEQISLSKKIDYILTEGSGSITDPRLSTVMLGIMYGTQPTKLIICHQMQNRSVDDNLSTINGVWECHERLMKPYNKLNLLGISVDTSLFEIEEEAQSFLDRVKQEFSCAVSDPLRFGVTPFVKAVSK